MKEPQKYVRELKERKEKYRTITTICPEHTGNYKQKAIITKDRVYFTRCYCSYAKEESPFEETEPHPSQIIRVPLTRHIKGIVLQQNKTAIVDELITKLDYKGKWGAVLIREAFKDYAKALEREGRIGNRPIKRGIQY